MADREQADVEALTEAISARLQITTDRITGLTHGTALSADTSAAIEAARAVLASDWLAAHDARVAKEARAEADSAITWGTTCLNCAKLLDRAYGEWTKGHAAGRAEGADR